MEEGAEPPEMETFEITEASVAEELRQLGAELRIKMSDDADLTTRVEKAVKHADQVGIARANVTGLMGILDNRDALNKARQILRRMRPKPRTLSSGPG